MYSSLHRECVRGCDNHIGRLGMTSAPVRRWARLLGVMSLFAMLIGAPAAPVQPVSAAAGGATPQVLKAEHHDVSPPLRDLHATTPASTGANRQIPLRHPKPPGAPSGANGPDKAAQAATSAPAVATTAGLNFDGLASTDACNCAPPDTEGAVGATQYVQWVNVKFSIFNKSTGASVLGPVTGNTLWAGFGGDCETTNDGDPIVLYDKMAGRWF